MFTFLSKTRKLEIFYSEKETNNSLEQKKKNPTEIKKKKKQHSVQTQWPK